MASLPRKRGGGQPATALTPGLPRKERSQSVDLSGMDFRFDPVHLDKYEAITGPGQFGNTFDEWGNRFVCDNRHHLRHIVMENRYVKRNPYLAAPALVEDISVLEDGPLSSGGKVYPISKNWTTSSLHEGRFTAACGVFIYHGNLLDQASLPRKRGEAKAPPANAGGSLKYHGAAFTCEPTGNLVHMEILTPKGATFSAKPHKQGVEFLATPDDWFRPVFLSHGPEGAMYVVDMYRAVIEHPDFMPPELKNRPDLWAGKDKGRIWRIVPKDHVTKTPRPGLSKAPVAELVKTLEHAEPWHRTTAQRLLLERNDPAMIEPLTKLLERTKSPHAKILAAWMLERQGKLSDVQLDHALFEAHGRLREQAWRIFEPRLVKHGKIPWVDERWTKAFREPDAGVRFQIALAVGGLGNLDGRGRTQDILDEIARAGYGDRWTRLAVQASLPHHNEPIYAGFLARNSTKLFAPAMIREMSALVAAQKIPDYELITNVEWMQKSVADTKWISFVGMAEGLERRGHTLVSVSRELQTESDRAKFLKVIDEVFSQAAASARDAATPSSTRISFVRILSHAPWPTAKQSLVPLVEKEPNTELRIAALRALAAQQDKEVPALLMKLWPSSAPSVRREILEAMLRQPGRVQVLLDEIEAKRLKAGELDPLRTKQLVNHKDPAIQARARKLLANNLPADRAKVLADYQPALTLKGDAKNGKAIFQKNCATCHRVAGIGIDVGPDIADTRTKTLGGLLNDILAPNAAIDANYVNYVVTTKDGRILTGLLTAESASSITLVRAEKQVDVVLRKDVDEIASTGISLMPEGLEKGISVQEMADLLGFLKNWRYMDGSIPQAPR